ncbi:MAG: hypothetical protein J3K34DRAFT_456412 [Monoraphidium minutum]|nr:MAG: hypothetical protein J3K34DRAFT_456412 [Monoraphidium minutum]
MLSRAALAQRPHRLCGCIRSRSKAHTLQRVIMSAAAQTTSGGDLDSAVEAVVRGLHENDTKVVCYVTGGASQAAAWLLGVPGASATVLEVTVPYCRDSLVGMLGQEPAQYCSEATALAMARAAYRRAADLTPFGTPVLGAAATCALASEPPKRGAHRAYVATYGADEARVAAVALAKGARGRWQEDGVVSRLLLQAAPVASCPAAAWRGRTPPAGRDRSTGPAADEQSSPQPPRRASPCACLLRQLLAGRARCVEFSGGRVFLDAPRSGRVYLPGSFNPLHGGHTALLAAACAAAGRPEAEGCFELSGMLPLEEVRRRAQQFVTAGTPLLVTSAPLYVDKARLLPRSVFVVGHDTAARLVLPKYYRDSELEMALEFAIMRSNGCSLLVAGRQDAATGRFLQLSDIQIPSGLGGLLAPIPEAAFRMDLSSTELRRAGQGLAAPAAGGGGGGSEGPSPWPSPRRGARAPAVVQGPGGCAGRVPGARAAAHQQLKAAAAAWEAATTAAAPAPAAGAAPPAAAAAAPPVLCLPLTDAKASGAALSFAGLKGGDANVIAALKAAGGALDVHLTTVSLVVRGPPGVDICRRVSMQESYYDQRDVMDCVPGFQSAATAAAKRQRTNDARGFDRGFRFDRDPSDLEAACGDLIDARMTCGAWVAPDGARLMLVYSSADLMDARSAATGYCRHALRSSLIDKHFAKSVALIWPRAAAAAALAPGGLPAAQHLLERRLATGAAAAEVSAALGFVAAALGALRGGGGGRWGSGDVIAMSGRDELVAGALAAMGCAPRALQGAALAAAMRGLAASEGVVTPKRAAGGGGVMPGFGRAALGSCQWRATPGAPAWTDAACCWRMRNTHTSHFVAASPRHPSQRPPPTLPRRAPRASRRLTAALLRAVLAAGAPAPAAAALEALARGQAPGEPLAAVALAAAAAKVDAGLGAMVADGVAAGLLLPPNAGGAGAGAAGAAPGAAAPAAPAATAKVAAAALPAVAALLVRLPPCRRHLAALAEAVVARPDAEYTIPQLLDAEGLAAAADDPQAAAALRVLCAARNAQLDARAGAGFSWEMPDAVAPFCPDNQAFLRGPEPRATFTGMFSGVTQARLVASKLFGKPKERDARAAHYTAHGEAGGQRVGAWLVVTKTRAWFDAQAAAAARGGEVEALLAREEAEGGVWGGARGSIGRAAGGAPRRRMQPAGQSEHNITPLQPDFGPVQISGTCKQAPTRRFGIVIEAWLHLTRNTELPSRVHLPKTRCAGPVPSLPKRQAWRSQGSRHSAPEMEERPPTPAALGARAALRRPPSRPCCCSSAGTLSWWRQKTGSCCPSMVRPAGRRARAHLLQFPRGGCCPGTGARALRTLCIYNRRAHQRVHAHSSADDGPDTLRDLVVTASAGDHIVFNATLDGALIVLISDLEFIVSLTVRSQSTDAGSGPMVASGTGAMVSFAAAADDVELSFRNFKTQGVTFINPGYNNVLLSINNCHISGFNNAAKNVGGAVSFVGASVDPGRAQIGKTLIENSALAHGRGAAVYMDNAAELSGALAAYIQRRGTVGGRIMRAWASQNLPAKGAPGMQDCTLRNNIANDDANDAANACDSGDDCGSGGAVYLFKGSAIIDCIFTTTLHVCLLHVVPHGKWGLLVVLVCQMTHARISTNCIPLLFLCLAFGLAAHPSTLSPPSTKTMQGVRSGRAQDGAALHVYIGESGTMNYDWQSTANTIFDNTCTSPGPCASVAASHVTMASCILQSCLSSVSGSASAPASCLTASVTHYNAQINNIGTDDAAFYNTAYNNGGNMNRDPKLGLWEFGGTLLGSLMPQPDSPVINAGASSSIIPDSEDQRGNTRIQSGRSDMGAVETSGTAFSQCTLLDSVGNVINPGGKPQAIPTHVPYECQTSGANSECASACAAAGVACTKFMAHQCFFDCCSDVQSQSCEDAAAGTLATLNGYGVLCSKSGSVLADPHFSGFDGTGFLFKGYPGVFSLLSEPAHQVKAEFGSVGPSHGANTSIWMTGCGVRYGDALSLELKFDFQDPASQLKLYRDPDAKHATQMRVQHPETGFLHVEVNGRHSDHLIGSGAPFEGLPPHLTVFFPPKTAVNAGDRTDGPICVIITPSLELTISKETEDSMHLDLTVKVTGPLSMDADGVLGQTVGWTAHGAPKGAVVAGIWVAGDGQFEVKNGLLGAECPHNRFKAAAAGGVKAHPGASAVRRLLSSGPSAHIVGMVATAAQRRG